MLPCSPQSDNAAVPLRLQLELHLPALKRRALVLTRSQADADDLLSDTVERALRFEKTFLPGTKLKAWLFRIMMSVFVSRQRRRKRELRALDGLYHDPCVWLKNDPPAAMRGLSSTLEHAIRGLPGKFSEVLWLVDLHDLSYREAAEVLSVPVGTVMSRLSRGRRRLAAQLACRPAALANAA